MLLLRPPSHDKAPTSQSHHLHTGSVRPPLQGSGDFHLHNRTPSPYHSTMRTSSLCAALLASVASASRPTIVASPKQPRLPVPTPAERTKDCTVKTHGNGTDDSAYILAAFHECNNGGHVLFSANTTYTVGTAMDWTFLKSIDIGEWRGGFFLPLFWWLCG